MPLPEWTDDSGELLSALARPELDGLVRLLGLPQPDVAANLSHLLARYVPHSALVMMVEDDVRQPCKSHGDARTIAALNGQILESACAALPPNQPVRVTLALLGAQREILATRSSMGSLLVLADPGDAGLDQMVVPVWQIVSFWIQEFARQASPAYLIESRAVASVRVEAVAELEDQHSSVLESLLAVLRSPTLDDHTARMVAANLATNAAVELRTATDRLRTAAEEPVTSAFNRLKNDLNPLLRYRDVNVQFVEPPADGRALPSEVAHGARAVVRGAIQAFIDQPDVSRIRVQWDCDGKNLLIDVRDDGKSGLAADSEQVQPLGRRVAALNGSLSISTTEGWGSEMSVVLPLDPPALRVDGFAPWGLGPRELEVLERIATGLRNKEIAVDLGISENTVKFHASNVYRKLGVSTRAQAATVVSRRRAALPAVDRFVATR
ncbi:LuxR C-terminal-related transcriptional regulator [Pedococcus sp. NPDC057267]|uniref:helix-turn-helix transcriptional regulator n=1 Tax=Pedococcus sp. NPDC057267 TaxID=3346077 RepID=UPI0036443A1B